MDKLELIKEVEKEGWPAVQKCPVEFFDDENFVDSLIYANEVHISRRQQDEKADFYNVIRLSERAHFDDVLSLKMEERGKRWQKRVREDFSVIKDVPFDLIVNEKFLRAIKKDNAKKIKWGVKHGFFGNVTDIENAKKKMESNFALAIKKRQNERRMFWEKSINDNNRNILFIPFDLLYDDDFRRSIYEDALSDKKGIMLKIEKEKLDDLFSRRIEEVQLVDGKKTKNGLLERKK